MKKLLICVALLGLVASTVTAEPMVNPNDRSQAPIFTSAIAAPHAGGARTADYANYSNLDTPGATFTYVSGAPTGGAVSSDDFTTSPNAAATLDHFTFVGGVQPAGGVAFMTFFSSLGSVVDSFAMQLPYGGTYIWTITNSGGTSMGVSLPANGFVQMWANDGVLTAYPITQGIWGMSTDNPTIGSTGTVYPGFTTTGGTSFQHNFEMLVPEPGTLALFGMGVLTLVVRRRR